ncbi:MAG: M81 family metallopeptidase [Cyclobacteriaceae bacterium]
MRGKVALLGLYHESNTFLTTKTSLKDFEKGHLLYGDKIREEYSEAFHEIGGMLEVLDVSAFEAVPLVFAEATPGGVVTNDTLQYLFEKISFELREKGPFDGIMVALHGAAVSELYPDMDGWWLEKLRAIVGDAKPVIGTLDPHANVSQKMIDATNALVAYKTNPHVDQRATGLLAARLMVDTLEGKIRPRQYFYQPPATISIEQQYTSGSPCKELYALAEQATRESKILSVSVLLGFPYADVKEMGSGFIVVSDDDEDLAKSTAETLGDYLWDHRADFVGKKISVKEAVDAVEHHAKPVLLLDMGDNVGGGSPGDSTFILEALERSGKWKSFICIYDPGSVTIAYKFSPGRKVSLTIGGKTDPHHGQPYTVEVTIKTITEGIFKEHQPRHGGQVNFNMGKIAIVETEKGTTIMLTTLRIAPFSLNQLLSFGIQPEEYDVIVAKGVHAPIAAYKPVCKSFVQVNTEGVTQADLTRFSFQNRRNPLYPFEDRIG